MVKMVNDHTLDEDKPDQNVETMNVDCFALCNTNLSSSASRIGKKSDCSVNSLDGIVNENSNNSSESNFDVRNEELPKSLQSVTDAWKEESVDWTNGGELNNDDNSNASKTDVNSSNVDAEKDEDEMSVSENEDHLPSDQLHRYTCPVCNYVVDKTSEFTAHLRKHNTSTPTDKFFNCTVCGKTLCSISSLDRHMLVHSGERPFQCTVCGMSFTTNGNMHRHMRTHGVSSAAKRCRRGAKITKKQKCENRRANTTNSGTYTAFDKNEMINTNCQTTDDKLKCDVCDKSFVSVYGLQAHIETHSFTVFNCDICKLSFETVESFDEHKFVAHSKEKLGGSSINEEAFDELQECNGFMELGKVCDFTVPKFPLIAQAWCEENPVQSCSRFHNFSCRKCKKSFPCKAAFALHKKQHDIRLTTYCDVCGAHFMTHEKLNIHKEMHILVESETTDDQSDFLAALNLRRNSLKKNIGYENFRTTVGVTKEEDNPTETKIKLSSSDNDKPDGEKRALFSPVVTDSPSSDLADIKDILEMTARVQSVEQLDKQQDPIVSSSTVSPGYDAKDKNVNHLPEETPGSNNSGMLLCTHCNAPFSNIRSLKSHTRTHYGLSPYQCKICNYTTVDKSTLMRHLRSHNGERPYLCILCSYAFTTKANCERHIRNKHGRTARDEILPCIKHSPSTFPTSDNIDALHSPDTICCYCKKDFKFLRALQKHLRTHHSRHRNVFKPFQCKVCSFGFSTRNNCIRHVFNTHPDVDKAVVKSCVILQTANIETVVPIVAPTDGNPLADDKNNRNLEHMESNIDDNDDSNDSCLVIDDTFVSQSSPDQLANSQDCNSLINSVSLETDTSPVRVQADTPIDFSMSPIDLSMKKKPKGPDGDRCLANKNKVQHLPPPPQNSPSLEMMQNPLWVANNLPGFAVRQEPGNAMEDVDIANTPLLLEKCYNNALQKWICPHCADMFNSPAKLKIHSMTHKVPKKLQCYFCPNTFVSKASLDAHLHSYHHVKKNVLDEVKFDEVFNSNFPLVKAASQKTSIFPSLPPPNLHPPIFGFGLMPNNFAMDLEKIRNSVRPPPAYTDMLKIQVDDDLYRSNYPQCKTLDYDGELKVKELRKSNNELPSISGTLPENFQASQETDLTEVSKMIEATDKAKFQEFLKTQDELYGHSSGETTTSSMTSPDTTKPSPPGIDSEKKKGRSSYSLTPHKYSCPHCERRFPWESSLQRHILTHTGQKPFKCPKCPVSFSTKSNRVRHLARKHGTVNQIISPPRCKSSPFNCTVCANGYSSMGNLRRHIILKHPEHNPNSLIKQSIYAVSPADQSIDSTLSAVNPEYAGNGITSSVNHFSSMRNASAGDDAGDGGSSSGEQDEDNDAAYYCRHCDDVFSSMETLVIHSEIHKASTGSDGSFRCHICLSVAFSDRDLCLEHIEINHPEEYSDIIYTNGEVEEDKEANIADNVEKRIFCVFCLKKFWSSQDWRRHMRTHSGERPYECDICFRKFSLKHSMMRHRKIHSDETEPWPTSKPDHKSQQRSLTSSFVDDSGMGSSSSDIIQNLLGLDDASVIDRMLDNADKAAEILGVST